jgi:ABC-type uncharacterized transport system auxiliary subunit
MILSKWWLIWLIPVWTAGCASLIFPSSPPPVYYQLDYQATPRPCPQAFNKGVRVWTFTSSESYRRTGMVVLKPGGEVAFSSAFQWVAGPGTLLPDSLQRDLTLSSLFPRVVGANDPTGAPLELSGHVFVFAWERTGPISRAALQIEVSLIDTDEAPRRIIFRREYDLRSGPFAEDTSTAFARAMSGLVAEWSQRLQQDLCAARKK